MARSTFDVPQPLRRIVARYTAAWLVCAVAGAAWAPIALAQDGGGPIVIPGPGETNSADLAKMTELATSGSGSKPRAVNPANSFNAAARPAAPAPAAADRFSALENANGAIVIPGSGEASAPGAPRMATAPQGNPADVAGVTRVNMSTSLAASQVVPVIVNPAPSRAANAAALRPVDAAPARGIEIDSLASRGEPPELGASPAVRAAAPRTTASQPQVLTQRPAQAAIPAQSQAQALAQAAQRAEAIQAMARAQSARGTAAPAAQAAQTVQTVQPVQAAQPVRAAQAAQPLQAAQPAQPLQAAQPVPAGQEDGNLIQTAALDFLRQQANGLPGHVELSVAPAFPRGLAACDTLQPFMPNGARLWGRTTVGVRCASGHPWTVWLQAKVSIHATYYVAARAMAPGEVIAETDLVSRDGDLTMLPLTIITAPSQAIGSITLMRVAAGLPLRQDMLKNAASVTAGTMVRVVAQGDGFSISSEGSALSNATPGQPVRVRTAAGQILMGIVKDSSTVQIQM
jgi:flagella basal body P-ring formation protein FlgA